MNPYVHNTGGIQPHSVGEFYPWSVVIYSGSGCVVGRCVPTDLVTGEELAAQYYDNDNDRSFFAARKECDRQIREAIEQNRERDYVSAMADLSELGYPS